MTKQQFVKGLLMIVVASVLSFLGQNPIDWALCGVTAVASILPYIGKNLFSLWPNNSPAGSFSWQNVFAGLFLAVGSGITESIALIVVEHKMIWPVLFKVVGGVTLSYITATFFSSPSSLSKPLFS
jgi:hypothetical protein